MAQKDAWSNSPEPLKELNTEHLYRTAEVIVIKKNRNFLMPGGGEKYTEEDRFYDDYAEFIDAQILTPAPYLDKKWVLPIEDRETGPGITTQEFLYTHYTVSVGASFAPGGGSDLTPGVGNTDIAQISCGTTVEGRGQC